LKDLFTKASAQLQGSSLSNCLTLETPSLETFSDVQKPFVDSASPRMCGAW